MQRLSKATATHLDSLGLRNGLDGRLGRKRKGASKGQPEHLTLYDLRGTALTRLIRHGLSLDEVALHMGWAPSHAAAMLDTYLALDPAQADAMIAKLHPATAGAIESAGSWIEGSKA